MVSVRVMSTMLVLGLILVSVLSQVGVGFVSKFLLLMIMCVRARPHQGGLDRFRHRLRFSRTLRTG